MEPFQLSPSQVRDFYLHGFLGLDSFLTPTELRIMRQVYDEWILTQKVEPSISFVDLAAQVPELRVCRFRQRALSIARSLLGDAATQKGEKYMYRPAGHKVETPWHQDWAFGSPNGIASRLNMWIPLQDTGTDGGCLWYMPGSHVQDILPHHNRTDIEVGHQKDVDAEADLSLFDQNQAVPMILPAGGIAIHHANTLHKADPNRSREPRRAYILSFSGAHHARWMKKDFDLWPWIAERRGDATAQGAVNEKPTAR